MHLLPIPILLSAVFVQANSSDVQTLVGHEGTVRPSFAPDGKTIATGSDDQTIKLWDVASGKMLRSLPGHGSGVWRVAFAPDGKALAGIAYQKLFLWDPMTGQQVRVIDAHSDTIRSVCFSPDCKMIATGGNDETVRLWDAATWKSIWSQKIERHGKLPEIVWSVAFSPDGKSLAVGSGNGIGGDGRVRVLDPSNGEVRHTFDGSEGEQVWAVAFSPDGKLLASGTTLGGRVTLRNSETWQVVREWTEGGMLRSLAWSPDGKMVATAIDKDVVLWDSATGKRLRTLSGHGNFIMGIAFSPDGKQLVSGGIDRTARVWVLE